MASLNQVPSPHRDQTRRVTMKTEMTANTETISRKEVDRIIARARQERSDWIAAALRAFFQKDRSQRPAAVPGRPLAC